MNKTEFIQLVKLNFKQWDEKRFHLFEKYLTLLQQENQKYNLTRLADDKLVFEKYFFVSLIPFINLDLKNKTILDIGSGSGIPGVVLKIIEPSIKLYLIESNHKKANFLKLLCTDLGLDDVEIFCARAEDVVTNIADQCDIVTSRAVASIPILLEISAIYTKVNGEIIIPKSQNYEAELNCAIPIQTKLYLEMIGCQEFILNKISYYTITYTKNAPTPKGFPRAWKEIVKDYE